MDNISKKLAEYFKTKEGLDRLMLKLKEKYISLSRPSGTITLSNITKVENIDISNLLGKKIEVNSTLKTSFKEITKKINEGKFNGFNWVDLFNYYFNQNIITNSQLKLLNKNEEEIFYKEIFTENINRKYIKEFNEMLNNDDINRIIRQKYRKNKKTLQQELNNILLLLDKIPSTPVPLAIYSSLTGNPHYLDLNKSTSNLFIRIVAYLNGLEYNNKTETKINILQEINVYTDPLSNYVITYKLLGNNILKELSNKEEVVNLNLLNINNLENITTKNKKVFVFENPSILNSLKYLNIPIIVTSGMPNIALYELLKKLQNSNTKIYYNGDFDPEGLLIAEKLKDKFPSLELFCYQIVDYDNSKSSEKISNSRLKKLECIKTKELQEIKKLLQENKLAGYQEKNLNNLKDYILNIIG